MTKRRLWAVLCVLALTSILASCGGGSSSSSTPPPAGQSSNWGELTWGTGTWSN